MRITNEMKVCFFLARTIKTNEACCLICDYSDIIDFFKNSNKENRNTSPKLEEINEEYFDMLFELTDLPVLKFGNLIRK
jgi:hypothetical protein